MMRRRPIKPPKRNFIFNRRRLVRLSLLVILLNLVLVLNYLWYFSQQSELSFPDYPWKSRYSAMPADIKLQQLLGIMVVGKADVYSIKDWLHRHVRIFETLVVIDGSESEFVAGEVRKYNNTVLLFENALNIENVTDQTLRKPAMSVLGDPVGRWIMLCHADEFWLIDPRRLVAMNALKQPGLNLLRLPVLTASPLESTYKKTVRKLHSSPASSLSKFHIMDVSTLAHNEKAKSSLARRTYFENRFFRWEENMQWGEQNHLVIPQHYSQYVRMVLVDAFYVHFKLHDFSFQALDTDGSHFKHSKLDTLLNNNSNEGWMGSFLDESFPEQLKQFPPRSIGEALYKSCTTYGNWRWPCELPWTKEAYFK